MYKCKSLLYSLALASLFLFPVSGFSDTRSAYGSNDSSPSNMNSDVDMRYDRKVVPMNPNKQMDQRQMDQQMRMRQQYPQGDENSYNEGSDVSSSSYNDPALAYWRGGWGGWRGYGGYGYRPYYYNYGYRPYYYNYGYRPYYYYSPYYYNYPYYSYGW